MTTLTQGSKLADQITNKTVLNQTRAKWRKTNFAERTPSNSNGEISLSTTTERQTKAHLAERVNEIIRRNGLSQTVAARLLKINQPKISALANYRLEGFSVERLLYFLTALDRDVEIVIRKKPRSRRLAKIVVIAA